ncbi:MAG: 30S ribosomal protein S5 [Candidatus Pacebacteria bacterium]|jgi:small subunit ribosomal protein S5|nr:30S ribosomal protein S5 [Candidatus Paceibacterota bacterium]
MAEPITKPNTTSSPSTTPRSGAPRSSAPAGGFRASTPGYRGGSSSRTGSQGSGPRRGGPRREFSERPKPEFDQKIISIRRVTRVVAGGRRFSLSVAMAIGDKKGNIGLGTGKAIDTSLAINKAVRSARKNMITLKLTKDGSIPYDVSAKFGSSKVMIMPNRTKGLVAGAAARELLVLGGVKNVTSKVLSKSKNKLNNARAAFAALSKIATRKVEKAGARDEIFS